MDAPLTPTIAAIATPPGEGGIGVVRSSGPLALEIATKLTGSRGPWESHRACVRTLRHGGVTLDRAVVLPFVGPGSFTGEHVVEYQCHGGHVVLHRVLDAIVELGARPAEAGEFTRQALRNGRLDLVQAEAIADLVHAGSEAARAAAVSHLEGGLSEKVDAIKERVVDLLTLVEAAIDFSLEEHVFSVSSEEIEERLAPAIDALDALLATWDDGRLRHDGVRVAIVGRPNAGKSTLLNALLGHDRALVTEVPGTTRDYLEETARFGGVAFRLVDTAGLRDADDRVEALGIERARAIAATSDAAILVVDARDPDALPELVAAVEGRPFGVLWNKTDLAKARGAEVERAVFAEGVCLVDEASWKRLPRLLLDLAHAAGLRRDEHAVVLTRARHRDALRAAKDGCERARDAATAGMAHELIALDIREALDALGGLTGAVTSDAILARIFDGFCIGK